MALTPKQTRRAASWFVRSTYRKERQTAELDVRQIHSAIASLDAWLDTPPGGGASNIEAIRQAIASRSRSKLTLEQIGILFAATIQARVNAKTVERE